MEGLQQLLLLLGTDGVPLRPAARAGVAVRHFRVEVDLVAAIAVPLAARHVVELAVQQIDLFEVAPLLLLLGDQTHQALFDRQRNTLIRRRLRPPIPSLPTVHRHRFDAEHFRDARHAIALPVQGARNAARIHFRVDRERSDRRQRSHAATLPAARARATRRLLWRGFSQHQRVARAMPGAEDGSTTEPPGHRPQRTPCPPSFSALPLKARRATAA